MSYRDQGGWPSSPLTLASVPCIPCLAVSYHGMAMRLAGIMGECCWWVSRRKIWRWYMYGRSAHNNRQLFLRKTAIMVTNSNDHCNLVQGCLALKRPTVLDCVSVLQMWLRITSSDEAAGGPSRFIPFYYWYAPHNDVSVNGGPHIRRWPHKIIL
jgi:hypothetical protein